MSGRIETVSLILLDFRPISIAFVAF
jgi:hypothetical protein